MQKEEIQRIIDSFHIGKVGGFWELDKKRILVETSNGIYGLVAIDNLQDFPVYDDKDFGTWINSRFGTSNGELVRTQIEWPKKSNVKIPVIHKSHTYFCCIRL